MQLCFYGTRIFCFQTKKVQWEDFVDQSTVGHCCGLNCYNKRGSRGTPFTWPSPTQDIADPHHQQYSREEYHHLILQPIVWTITNELSNGMLDFAQVCNPYFMRPVQSICTRWILTPGESNQDSSSYYSLWSFANATHVDSQDSQGYNKYKKPVKGSCKWIWMVLLC